MTPLLASALALLAGCDLQKTANQLSARSVVVATVLATPPVTIKPAAIAGLDGGLFALDAGTFPLDGGLPFDAGLPIDLRDGGLGLPAQNVVLVFFGQRQGDGLDVAPQGVPGAQVTLQQVNGPAFPLVDQGGGNYLLSGDDAGFRYASSASYQFKVVAQNETYVAEVNQVPSEERIAAFEQPSGFIDQVAGQPLTFIRPEPPQGQKLNLGFVNVFPIDASGRQGVMPTYTNVPVTPLQFLKLVGDAVGAQTEYRAQSVTIPGSAFSERDRNYIIVFQSAKTGGPRSDNLFTGSAVIAGTAVVAVVKTRP
ncbi:MAG: hypothetical protein INH41_00595 [Myxococcaceae bacterium]|nr:hypothetical protein [Myxococcaceae bacterium]